MNRIASIAASAAFAAVVSAACGPRSIRHPERPGEDLIVLLPDAGGTVGRATVSNKSGMVDLSTARAMTSVSASGAPAPVTTMSEDAVERLFGEALEALPPAPKRFTLFFRFDSEELTDESGVLMQEVLNAIKDRSSTDVVVLGHTDTTGTAALNYELGLRRANKIRAALMAAGVRRASIDVASYGERELLVRTGNGVFEPRNRRVEITIR